MESAEKVRLVMCPKCENVLPELPDYSVYQCGGCGAVLRAKGKFQENKLVPGRCDDESNGAVGETLERCSGNTAALVGVVPAQDIEPGIGSLSLDQRSSEESIRDAKPGIGETKDRSGEGEIADMQNVNTPGISPSGENGGFRSRADSEGELHRSEPISKWRKSGLGNMVGSLMNGYGESRGVKYSTSKQPHEGPSDYNSSLTNNSREAPLRKHDVIDGGHGALLLESDREELLRKLDELKNQLSRSYDVGTGREGIPINGSMVARDTFGHLNTHSPIASSSLSKASREQFDAYRHSAGLPYFSQYPNSFPHTNSQDVMHNYSPLMHSSNHYSGFCDNYAPQIHRSDPCQYDKLPPHGLISGQYLDASCDPFRPVPNTSIPHQSTCSCFHCLNNHREASAPVPPTAFCKYPNVSPSKSLHYFENPGAFGSNYISPRSAVPPFNSYLPRPYIRQPSEFTSEGFMHRQPQRVLSNGGRRRSRPIAGGAPFLACSSCFELLQLPRKVLLKPKHERKIQCGACSAVISYDLISKKLVFSAQTESKKATAEDGDSSCEVIKGGYMQPHDYITGTSNRFSSDDFENSGFDFLSSERAQPPSTGGNNLSLTNSREMESISPRISDQENSPGLVDSGDSMKQARNVTRSPPPPGSPLQDHFDHSSCNHSANRFGKGNLSSRSDHEKVLSSKTVLRQNSLQEATLATEMEVSFNECSDNHVSGDSGDARREYDQPRGNKGESFLSNIFKKSFKDHSRSGQNDERGRAKVYINGHLIPDRLIKKAEKLAGPIHPGKYWYDFRAGFWGVMSGPCLGIIPPYIQEFNYPMTENCAGGDTGVFVNSRELHQKDLDLLASRGLPTDRDRSYTIEISGRVYDEDTGEELDGLGKLAPTVEKVKHGFGMKAPKAADA